MRKLLFAEHVPGFIVNQGCFICLFRGVFVLRQRGRGLVAVSWRDLIELCVGSGEFIRRAVYLLTLAYGPEVHPRLLHGVVVFEEVARV